MTNLLIVWLQVDNVRMIDRYNTKNPTIGTLYITATHIIFVDPETNKETWVNDDTLILSTLYSHCFCFRCSDLQILHMHIGSLDKLPLTTTGSPLLIRCKTFLFVTFVIPREKECHDIYVTLQKLSQPVNIQNLYCFQYTSSNEELVKTAGWNYFTLDKEFRRQRVPNEEWALCNLNRNYELCDTCKILTLIVCLLIIFADLPFFSDSQTHAKSLYQHRQPPLCLWAALNFVQRHACPCSPICIPTRRRYVAAVSRCPDSAPAAWKTSKCLRPYATPIRTRITCMWSTHGHE